MLAALLFAWSENFQYSKWQCGRFGFILIIFAQFVVLLFVWLAYDWKLIFFVFLQFKICEWISEEVLKSHIWLIPWVSVGFQSFSGSGVDRRPFELFFWQRLLVEESLLVRDHFREKLVFFGVDKLKLLEFLFGKGFLLFLKHLDDDFKLAFALGMICEHKEVLTLLGLHLQTAFALFELFRCNKVAWNGLKIEPCEILLLFWVWNQINFKGAFIWWHFNVDSDLLHWWDFELHIKIVQEVRAVDTLAAVGLLQKSFDLLLLDNALLWKFWEPDFAKWISWKCVLDLDVFRRLFRSN